jgi:hypothetical protein
VPYGDGFHSRLTEGIGDSLGLAISGWGQLTPSNDQSKSA